MSSEPLTLMETLRAESEHKGRTGKMGFSPREKPGWDRHSAFVGRQTDQAAEPDQVQLMSKRE